MLSKNPTSGYLLKNLKSGSQRDINTPVFTVALFTTDQMWKQPQCPSTDKQIKNVMYKYSGILFRLKKKEIL